MAAPFQLPVTALQVGQFFVGQYYQVLQQQPDFVHQFYSDSSTMIRIDGNTRETATGMLQIYSLVMPLNYSAIEIKTAQSLESWNGGVLVMVSGSVHIKDFSGSRKFVQTFFLAPQEKGYFVLNDIFHFVEEETVRQHPVAYLSPPNLDAKPIVPTAIREQVPSYVLGGKVQGREFVAVPDIKDNGHPVDRYSFREQQVEQVPEVEKILEASTVVQSNGSLQSTKNPSEDHLPAPVEEPVGEPQKHTYASILQVAKGQSPLSVSQPTFNKPIPPASDWHRVPEPPSIHQSLSSSAAVEQSSAEAPEEVSAVEDEGEVKSVYVRNLPSTVSASDLEEEFKKFGKLRVDGVAIRNRKEIGVCYAFVEFEDISGVQNAIKAAKVQVDGHQVFIEERRPNRNSLSRGGRRGGGRGGRGGYQSDAPRGRFGGGRGFGGGNNRGNGYYDGGGDRDSRDYSSRPMPRGNGHDGGDRDSRDYSNSRSRGNGFYRPGPGPRGAAFSNNQGSRNGHINNNVSE